MTFSLRREPGPTLSVAVGPTTVQVLRVRVLTEPVRSFRVELTRQSPIPGFDDPDRFQALENRLADLLAGVPGPKHRRVLVSIPARETVIRRVTLPTTRRDRLADLLSYEKERVLPIDRDRRVTDYQILRGDENDTRLLLVAARQQTLASYGALIREHGFEPRVVESAPLSLFNFYRFTRPTLSSGTRPAAKALLHLSQNHAVVIVLRARELLLARSVFFHGTSGGPSRSDAPSEPGKPERKTGAIDRSTGGEPASFDPELKDGVTGKKYWNNDDLVQELRKTFRFLESGETPGTVREIRMSGRRVPDREGRSLMERELDARVLPFNPSSRVEGIDPEGVPEAIVPLGLSLRDTDEEAELLVNLGSSADPQPARGAIGRLHAHAVSALILLLVLQLSAGVYLRWVDQRWRGNRTRRAWNRLQPAVQRFQQRRAQKRTLRQLLRRTRRARIRNRRILELLEQLSRVPPSLRDRTGFTQLRLDTEGARPRLHLSGVTGSYAQLSRLYRWLLGMDSVVEIRRENQRLRTSNVRPESAQGLKFEVTLSVEMGPDPPEPPGITP